jgi:hypothetical protein
LRPPGGRKRSGDVDTVGIKEPHVIKAAPKACLLLCFLTYLLAGTWTGLKHYGKLDETQFRKVVLALLISSAMPLLR